MVTVDLDRVFSALVTPTRSDDSINFEVIDQLVEEQLARGVEGFYCCGSSGEALLLSLGERREIVERVSAKVAGRVPVVAHVGTVSTAQTIELARAAQASGASAISMIPPYYYAFTADEIEQYYRDVTAAVDIPVLVYNIPQFTRIAFSKENLSALLADEQIVGMKHTDTNLFSLERLVTAFPEKTFVNGFDEQYLSALTVGARATIGTTVNIQPELFLRVRDRFESGDIAGARRTQRQINYVVETLVSHGVFQSAKYLACAREDVPGNCRSPFRPLDDADRAALDLLAGEIAGFIADDNDVR